MIQTTPTAAFFSKARGRFPRVQGDLGAGIFRNTLAGGGPSYSGQWREELRTLRAVQPRRNSFPLGSGVRFAAAPGPCFYNGR